MFWVLRDCVRGEQLYLYGFLTYEEDDHKKDNCVVLIANSADMVEIYHMLMDMSVRNLAIVENWEGLL